MNDLFFVLYFMTMKCLDIKWYEKNSWRTYAVLKYKIFPRVLLHKTWINPATRMPVTTKMITFLGSGIQN